MKQIKLAIYTLRIIWIWFQRIFHRYQPMIKPNIFHLHLDNNKTNKFTFHSISFFLFLSLSSAAFIR